MLVMAVALRLMTVDAMVVNPEFRGWLMSEKLLNGVTHIHGGLLEVAAEQAIPERTAGESTFDRESFRTHL
jgi:hypothetical protein